MPSTYCHRGVAGPASPLAEGRGLKTQCPSFPVSTVELSLVCYSLCGSDQTERGSLVSFSRQQPEPERTNLEKLVL